MGNGSGGPTLKENKRSYEEAHGKLKNYLLSFHEAHDNLMSLAADLYTSPAKLVNAKSKLDYRWEKLKEAVIVYLPILLQNSKTFGEPEYIPGKSGFRSRERYYNSKEILDILSKTTYDLVYSPEGSPGPRISLSARANGKTLSIEFSTGCGNSLLFYPDIQMDLKTTPKKQK